MFKESEIFLRAVILLLLFENLNWIYNMNYNIVYYV